MGLLGVQGVRDIWYDRCEGIRGMRSNVYEGYKVCVV